MIMSGNVDGCKQSVEQLLSLASLRESELVILAPIDSVNDLFTCVSTCELKRARGYYHNADQLRSLTAHGLKRWCLGRILGVSARELSFVATAHGKPLVNSSAGIGFSLSHSGCWVAIAISMNADIGVDVEFPGCVNRMAIVDQVLSSYQLVEYLSDRSWHRFLCYWTQKEATSKAVGLGLTMEYRDIDCSGKLGTQLLGRPFENYQLISQSFDHGVLTVAGRKGLICRFYRFEKGSLIPIDLPKDYQNDAA